MTTKWTAEQTYHGGQEHSTLSNFVEDFSVTCNALGTPSGALSDARAALGTIEHYPAADQQPALSDLAAFIAGESAGCGTTTTTTTNTTSSSSSSDDGGGDDGKVIDVSSDCPDSKESIESRLVLGNGASELIDLVTRLAPKGVFRPGPTVVQYKEYERAARADGRDVIPHTSSSSSSSSSSSGNDDDNDNSKKKTAILSLVNPCNPTGDFFEPDEMIDIISRSAEDGTSVIVDESMIMWHGVNWRAHSLLSKSEWIRSIKETRGINVFIMVSWTKIWACPGIRIGSLLCPDPSELKRIKTCMVPWSVNSAALAFISSVVKDTDYMRKTWEITSKWRQELIDSTPSSLMKPHGKHWLSWVWFDCGDEAKAEALVNECKNEGIPIRWAKYGYKMPQFVRFGVRDPKFNVHVKKAIERAFA